MRNKKLKNLFKKRKVFREEFSIKFKHLPFEMVAEKIIKALEPFTKDIKTHTTPSGEKTFVLLLLEGMFEIHYLGQLELTYMILTCQEKKLFDKIKKLIQI